MNQEPGFQELNPPTGLSAYINTKETTDENCLPFIEDCTALSDQELISLTVKQRKDALETLYDRYSGALFSLASHMLRDPSAAEEVTQDAFFKVWRKASTYRADRGKVSAWLFSIAHHRVIDEMRRRKRREQAHSHQNIELVDQPTNDSTDPAKYAMLQMSRNELKEALFVLRPEQREIVLLSYYRGLTQSEIAKHLEQPLGTVKTRMRLALKKLREVLRPQEREWADNEV